MFCPKCSKSFLKKATVKDSGGVEIDYCPACKGFWLNAGEMEKVCETADKSLKIPLGAEKQGWVCPECLEDLRSFEYPQTLVEVDVCKSCGGLWIDAGELKEIETVRRSFKEKGKLWVDDEGGVKGALIEFIDTAIDTLRAM